MKIDESLLPYRKKQCINKHSTKKILVVLFIWKLLEEVWGLKIQKKEVENISGQLEDANSSTIKD